MMPMMRLVEIVEKYQNLRHTGFQADFRTVYTFFGLDFDNKTRQTLWLMRPSATACSLKTRLTGGSA